MSKKNIGVFLLLAGAMALFIVSAKTEAQRGNNFMMKAAQSGMAEIALSNLALQKSSNEQVRSTAQMIIDDHTRANDELKTLAASKNVTLPTEVSSKQQATENSMRSLEGENFDTAYIRQMIRDHEASVKMFDKESRNTKDGDTSAFAAKHLPALQQHLQMVRSVSDRNNSGSSGNSNSNMNSNMNGNMNMNSNSNMNSNRNMNSNMNGNINSNSNMNGGWNSNGNMNSNMNMNGNMNSNMNQNSNRNSNNGNSNMNGNSNSNRNTNMNGNSNVNSNRNTNSNVNSNRNTNSNSNVNSNFNAR